MMELYRFIIRAAALVLALSNTGTTSAEPNPDRHLKVGFIAPLSGAAAAYGTSAKNGFNLALAEFGGGKVDVIFEDDQYTPAKTVAAFKKLVQIDRVDLIVSIASTPSNAIAPLAEAAKIPLIAWANDPKVARARSFVVISEQSAEVEGAKIAREALRRGYQSLALVTSTGDYQSAVKDGLQKVVPTHVVFDEEMPAAEQYFRSLLGKIRAKNPSAIWICFQPGQFGIFAKQARELGINAPLFGCNAMQNSSELRISAGALAGAWYVSPTVDEDFKKKYLTRFGNDDVIAGAAVHYEVGKLLAAFAHTAVQRQGFMPWLFHSGEHRGAVGLFTVKRENEVQYFDIQVAVKEL